MRSPGFASEERVGKAWKEFVERTKLEALDGAAGYVPYAPLLFLETPTTKVHHPQIAD
jgi:hypothetical protein